MDRSRGRRGPRSDASTRTATDRADEPATIFCATRDGAAASTLSFWSLPRMRQRQVSNRRRYPPTRDQPCLCRSTSARSSRSPVRRGLRAGLRLGRQPGCPSPRLRRACRAEQGIRRVRLRCARSDRSGCRGDGRCCDVRRDRVRCDPPQRLGSQDGATACRRAAGHDLRRRPRVRHAVGASDLWHGACAGS